MREGAREAVGLREQAVRDVDVDEREVEREVGRLDVAAARELGGDAVDLGVGRVALAGDVEPGERAPLVAGGCQVVAFTTGRGSCFGCKPTPSIKIATNTPMYERMIDDMDLNAGVILSGTPLEEVGRQVFETILEVASGRKTKSELHGVGEEEFAPWSIGPTL